MALAPKNHLSSLPKLQQGSVTIYPGNLALKYHSTLSFPHVWQVNWIFSDLQLVMNLHAKARNTMMRIVSPSATITIKSRIERTILRNTRNTMTSMMTSQSEDLATIVSTLGRGSRKVQFQSLDNDPLCKLFSWTLKAKSLLCGRLQKQLCC